MVADEAIRSRGVRGREDRRPFGAPGLGEAVVHVVRRVEAEPRVPVLGVVPRKEVAVMCAGVINFAEIRRRYLSVLNCASE